MACVFFVSEKQVAQVRFAIFRLLINIRLSRPLIALVYPRTRVNDVPWRTHTPLLQTLLMFVGRATSPFSTAMRASMLQSGVGSIFMKQVSLLVPSRWILTHIYDSVCSTPCVALHPQSPTF